MTTQNIESQFVNVSKAEFFAVMGPLDVTPRPQPERKEWHTRDGAILGLSTPGYRNTWGPDGATPKVYQLASRLAPARR